jgi:flagellum-specific peptidoglycan hydrolase FlgJ
LGKKNFGYSQRWTSRDQTYESSPSKKKITNFKLWEPLAFAILFISLSSCSSKKIITERQIPKVKKEVLKSNTINDHKVQSKTPIKVMSNKEKIIAYVALYSPIAQKEMKSYGIPASITLAQGILESGMGYGRLAVEGNNHFGIKCHKEWNGKRIYHDDDKKGECFRVYKDPENSFRDHSLFLRDRSRYAFLFDIKINQYKAWAKGLKKAGYATDPKYPDKLISLIERFDLTRFDEKNKIDQNSKKESKIQTIHLVKKGDTLYSVSKKYNVTVDRIIELNKIKDQTIYLGQSLNISNP